MSIAVVSSSSGSGTVTAPAGIVAGNLLVAMAGGATPPSGWTQVVAPSGLGPGAWYRVATSSEPLQYAFSARSQGAVTIVQLSGVASSPVDDSGTGSIGSCPAVTPSAAGDFVLCFGYNYQGGALGTPSGLTTLVNYQGTGSGFAWGETLSSTAPAGPFAYAGGSANGGSLTIAIKAAVTAFTGTAAQQLPPLTQTAAAARTVPAFHAAAAQTLPALTQAASGPGPFTISVTVAGPDVTITWPAQDAATAGYAVERDGAIIAFGITDTSYIDTPPDGTRGYRVDVLA